MRKEMVTLLATSFILLCCISLASCWSNIQRENTQQKLLKAFDNTRLLERFLSNLKDVETGVRGYILTRKESFLKPYLDSRQTYPDDKQAILVALKERSLKDELYVLFVLADARVKRADERVKAIQTHNTRFNMGEGTGRRLMDAIRLQTAHIIAMEDRKLQRDLEKNQAANTQFTLIFWAGFIIILVMQSATFYLMNSEIEQRKASENSLEQLNNDLERMVEERTYDLKKQLSLVKSITSSVKVGILQVDTSNRIIFANESATNLLEAHQTVLLGQNLFNLVKGASNSDLIREMSRVLTDGGTIAPSPITLTTAMGEPLTVLATASANMLGSAIIGAVISFQDLTALRLIEKEKADTLEQFSMLANSLPQLTWMADGKGWIYWYNQRWYDYTGTTLEEMQGWGWKAVHHPEHLERVVKKVSACWDNGVVFEDTFPLRGKDGQYRWFLTRALPIRNDQGEVVKWFGTNTDITEQIQTQMALKEREAEIMRLNQNLERRVEERTLQLQTTNKELETFSYSVSHDLRAPLRSISGFSQALLKQKQLQLDVEGQDYLYRILANAQKMGTLIDDLLQLSRLTRGELNREPVNLGQLAQQVLDNLHADPHGDDTPAQIDIEPDLVVNGDKRLLYIVLDNLINNAWKFTGKKAHRHIHIGKTTRPDKTEKTVFFVKDNGSGFEMAYVHKLFGAFQRLHAMDEFPGNGIGLATVQRIIHRHDGDVWAEAVPGEGATFYFAI
jgi:PAS domain S-box-containing protein